MRSIRHCEISASGRLAVMSDIRLSRALCAVVGNFVQGSHPTLDALFKSSGAPGDPPALAHHSKWKEWLFQAGQDESVDSLKVLGNILEEFMDVPPMDPDLRADWEQRRQLVIDTLEADGLAYFRGGQVLPSGRPPENVRAQSTATEKEKLKPSSIEELLQVLLKGLPRAIQPLIQRRKGSVSLTFSSEYDIQDLLHALLRPWIADVRAEEFTPSYAGSSTRMDFLLPEYSLVIETKLVRDKPHSKNVGNELIIDIDHYRAHPNCKTLWCVIYDPNHFISNAAGLVSDLEGESRNGKGTVTTRVFILQP